MTAAADHAVCATCRGVLPRMLPATRPQHAQHVCVVFATTAACTGCGFWWHLQHRARYLPVGAKMWVHQLGGYHYCHSVSYKPVCLWKGVHAESPFSGSLTQVLGRTCFGWFWGTRYCCSFIVRCGHSKQDH